MKKKNKYQHQGKYKYDQLKSSFKPYKELKCYSFNKKNNKADFDQITSLLPQNFITKEEVQSIDMIYSGSTNNLGKSELYITLVVGRIDKQMFDYDVFNIGSDNSSGDTYSIMQAYHFKDENGIRLTENYTTQSLNDINDMKNELYKNYLTGRTESYSIEEYEKENRNFLEAHHQSFKEVNSQKGKNDV
ncbi:hypothetical protein TH61_16390 [Rufibacter sp. DG15C]|uniref:hypothetical protein n=1 Tax=Rufibacter sp. DG15C TaxID=1379909 RepID=UPI00078CC84E|nr:hypothetical protein [Rufibacter sp. DG15C]AMM52452.1 hypothetical protein TH61_16390 [Rufibacter sp. DG15C]